MARRLWWLVSVLVLVALVSSADIFSASLGQSRRGLGTVATTTGTTPRESHPCLFPAVGSHEIDELHRSRRVSRLPHQHLFLKDDQDEALLRDQHRVFHMQRGSGDIVRCPATGRNGSAYVLGNWTWHGERQVCAANGTVRLPAGHFLMGGNVSGYVFRAPKRYAARPEAKPGVPSLVVVMLDAMSTPQYRRSMFSMQRQLQLAAVNSPGQLISFNKYHSFGGSSRRNKVPLLAGVLLEYLKGPSLSRGPAADSYPSWIFQELRQFGYKSVIVDSYCPSHASNETFDPSKFSIHHFQHYFPTHWPMDHQFPSRAHCEPLQKAAGTRSCCFTSADMQHCDDVRARLVTHNSKSGQKCTAGEWSAAMGFRWLGEVIDSDRGPFFAYVDIWDLHQGVPKGGYNLDGVMAKWIKKISPSFNDTIYLFTSDHGNQEIYVTYKYGDLEHRMPLLQMIVPRRIMTKYPALAQNLLHNAAEEITTPLDLYHTMLHFASLPEMPPRNHPAMKGQSLLWPVPEHRTCEQALIPVDACLCGDRSPFRDLTDDMHVGRDLPIVGGIVNAAKNGLHFINEVLSGAQRDIDEPPCRYPLKVRNVTNALGRTLGEYTVLYKLQVEIESDRPMLMELQVSGPIKPHLFAFKQLTRFTKYIEPCRERARKLGIDFHLCDCT